MKRNHSDCDSIETLIYLTEDELQQEERARLEEHTATCAACAGSRRAFLTTRKAILSSAAPVAEVPVFRRPTESRPAAARKSPQKILAAARWISGIAALLLVGLFCMEQAVAVQKLNRLEKRIELTRNLSSDALPNRLALVRSHWTERELKDLVSSLQTDARFLNLRAPAHPAMLAGAGSLWKSIPDSLMRNAIRHFSLTAEETTTIKSLIR